MPTFLAAATKGRAKQRMLLGLLPTTGRKKAERIDPAQCRRPSRKRPRPTGYTSARRFGVAYWRQGRWRRPWLARVRKSVGRCYIRELHGYAEQGQRRQATQ